MIPYDAWRSYEDWRRLWLLGGETRGIGALRFHGLHDALALAGCGDASVKPRPPARASRAVAEPVIGDAALDEAARQVRHLLGAASTFSTGGGGAACSSRK